MVELIRNNETGIVEAWKDGKKIGEVHTMGDEINASEDNKSRKRSLG
jgi:hypothetical protein